MGEIKVPGFCALCRSRCGAIAVVEDGRLLRVEPNPEHPTGAALCVKGRAAPEIAHNPNRLLYPVRRTRAKSDADPGWERISWDDALTVVTERLGRIRAESGPEAVAFAVTSPSSSPISDALAWIMRLVNRFGSPNLCTASEICNWHKDYAHRLTFGRAIGTPDFARTGCVVLWGHNPSTAWLEHATGTAAAKARGAALIVVDPRRAGFAGGADLWLRVRPGSDAALALAIADQALRRGLLDRDFVARWTNAPLLVRGDTGALLAAHEIDPGLPPHWRVAWSAGRPLYYDSARVAYVDAERAVDLDFAGPVRLAGAVVPCATAFALYRARCAEYPAEHAAAITDVPAAQIAAAAELMHARAPVSYYAWTGVGQHHNATQTDRAIATLMALQGSVDAPGGNVDFGAPPTAAVDGAELLAPAQAAKALGAAQRPLGPAASGSGVLAEDVYRAILTGAPYRVRALVNFGSNLLLTHGAPELGTSALQALELMVHCGPLINQTAAHADIVLPVSTQWEREGLRAGFEVNERAAAHVQLRRQAIVAAGESRSDTAIVFALATRLGFGGDFWGGDIEAALDHQLAPLGLTAAALRAAPNGVALAPRDPFHRYRAAQDGGVRGFATETRLVELYSALLARHGYDPLPAHRAAEADARFPLLLTSAKVPHFCHSQYRDIPALRRRLAAPFVEIAPATAAAHGIADGAWVRVTTPAGSTRLRAKFDGGLAAGVLCASYGWWEPDSNAGSLVDTATRDPISGSPRLRGVPCAVAPA